MIRNGILFTKIVALFAGLFLLNGCLIEGEDYQTIGGGTKVEGASLSDAMKASGSGGGDIGGSSGSSSGTTVWMDNDSDSGGGGVGEPYYGKGPPVWAVQYDDRKYHWQVPVSVSYAVPFHGPIESLTRFSLTPVSLENEHHYLGLAFGGDLVDFRPGSLPATAIDRDWMFEMNLDYRYYLLSSRHPVDPYLATGIGLQALYWHYRNPVIIGGQVVHSDELNGGNGYLGLGVVFRRNQRISFFAEADFGGMLFDTQTVKGLHNDVITDFGYFNARAGLTIKF